MRAFGWILLASGAFAASAASAATNDTARIVDEGMNRSQVMVTAHELMDDIGPRLTNSTNMRKAQDWAVSKLTGYGLSNVHREAYDFGRGWDIVRSSVRLVSPRPIDLVAIPVAWSPATNGPLRAPVVVAPMNRKEQFAAYRGKLAGKIVLTTLPGTGDEPKEPAFKRLDSGQIAKLDEYEIPHFDPEAQNDFIKRVQFARELDAFLASEGAVAQATMSHRDGKLVSGEGYQNQVGGSPKLPTVQIAAEDYRRIARMAKMGDDPVLEIDSSVRYLDDDTHGYNIIADIPGTDSKAGYVMAGAHFDSWVAADGASDNGAGSVVVMEAARILRQIGARPKRTIRFALWTGEEQGLFGSLAYVTQHLARRPFDVTQDGIVNYMRWRDAYPITLLPGYGDLKAYFNMDNGSGKLRGIYAEGNAAAEPMLRDWLSPFESMGAGTVVAGPTGGTDHEFFQSVAIPGFQFIQDPLDYGSRVHHSSVDTLDHLRPDDLRQAAVVLAGVLLEAANSDKELPRPPLPTKPLPTDPFKYDYPDPK
ncbi:MAG TPA: M20/M25/M40 family metallo-hydrolase [Sphingomicrobium sp.]|nr:M20/M25/M40 family metallo-hydrolase [Sphingomicrobium sp.]